MTLRPILKPVGTSKFIFFKFEIMYCGYFFQFKQFKMFQTGESGHLKLYLGNKTANISIFLKTVT